MFDEFLREADPTERKRLHCPHCARLTIHSLEARCSGRWSDDDAQVSGGATFSTYRCGGCDAVSYETTSWDSESLDQDEHGEMYAVPEVVQYPTPISRDFEFSKDHTPGQLDTLLEETLYSFGGGNHVLATVGLRMVLEFIVKDAGCSGRNLDQRIANLRTKDLVDDDQLGLLQTIRKRGNAGAHEAKGMSARELLAGLQVVNLLLDKLYNEPGRTKHTVARAKLVLK